MTIASGSSCRYGDANITLLAPHRERFVELGCFLTVASDAALEIANDKTRTLEVAAKLDIAYPKSVQVSRRRRPGHGRGTVRLPEGAQADCLVDRPGVQAGRPPRGDERGGGPEATNRFLATGCEVIAQQLATGRAGSIASSS